MIANELAALFRRDIARLIQELEAFPDTSALWQTAPGVSNSAGNLALHLEGNLREYVGRQLGGVAYRRERPQEFAATGLAVSDLIQRIEAVKELVPKVIESLTAAQLETRYPEDTLGIPLSTQQFLIHTYGHFSYHLGQVDYLRRISTIGTAVRFAGL